MNDRIEHDDRTVEAPRPLRPLLVTPFRLSPASATPSGMTDTERADGSDINAAQLREQLSESMAEEIQLREQARLVELVPARAEEARELFRAASRLAEDRFEIIRWLLGLA